MEGFKMDEHEKEGRRHLYYYSRVYNENTHQMAGRLTDISTAKMMLVSEEPIRKDTKFKFKLVLPKAIEGKKALMLEARSKWSKRALNQDLFDNSFELLNVTSKTAEMIDRITGSVMAKY
jgi:hypothetical protein